MLKLFSHLVAARQLGLTLSEFKIFESLFDAEYYLATHPDVEKSGIIPEEHYLKFGWREGRNPGPNFETVWYLHTYEDAAQSGFNPLVHYARFGLKKGRTTSPGKEAQHWRRKAERDSALPEQAREFLAVYNKVQRSGLFDAEFYRAKYHFRRGDPLEFYLRHGRHENHHPNPNFDAVWYLANYADVRSSGLDPFLHYIENGLAEGRRTGPIYEDKSASERGSNSDTVSEERPAPLLQGKEDQTADLRALAAEFDDAFYRRGNPDLDFTKIEPLEHFARIGWREGRDPCPEFSVKGYLHHNSDVQMADMNPLLHYVLAGRKEHRISRPAERAPRVADGMSEWIGYDEVRQLGAESLEGCTSDTEAIEFCAVLAGLDLKEIAARINLRSPAPENVLVSIVIPCVDEELVTIECLTSIQNALPEDFGVEVIVVDNASTDPAYEAISKNITIRYLRFDKNIGFGPACNAGAKMAHGDFLFFLNNDAQIAPGCLEALVAGAKQEGIGLVGPKIVSFDGTLQEAGCILKQDGTGDLIGFGRDHRTPRYNYARPVEHVSGAAILVRRALFEELGGFDDAFAPAYCEDANLSLKIRRKSLRVLYEPKALIAHHLSKTSNGESESKRERISRNRNILTRRWADEIAAKQLRTIAFYLPQYHPIPENDLWWGKGFTEWTNVTKAKPNYVGHSQPRVPADLGYYDLRVPEVMEQQAALARRYGLTGFCYYYYWFDGKRVLEHPLERMLATGKPDLPFCLCWANENWTRRWDGMDSDVLLGQSYTDQGALEVIEDLARYFRSEAYIRIDKRPLVLVYRIKELPNPARVMTMWRNFCRRKGIGEICIAMVESFELSAKPEDPKKYGCDITVEFPAHGMVQDSKKDVSKINFDWTGSVHDYRQLAAAFMRRLEPGFPRIRSVLSGWDSTPRHPNKSLILDYATPGAFQAWLEWTYRRTLEQNIGDERIVFILAWNEWCEGSYLEPDRHFGHAYLQAVRNALDAVELGRAAFVQ